MIIILIILRDILSFPKYKIYSLVVTENIRLRILWFLSISKNFFSPVYLNRSSCPLIPISRLPDLQPIWLSELNVHKWNKTKRYTSTNNTGANIICKALRPIKQLPPLTHLISLGEINPPMLSFQPTTRN
jgi:hypothetical protein